MNDSVHEFDNKIKVYRHHLLELQKERYDCNNVHEADEEPVFLDVISRIKDNGVYVNVGAAIGYYPLLAASIRDDLKLISYEPLKLHREYFNENIKLNGFDKSRFIIYKEGVYSRAGVVDFVVDSYGSMIVENKRKKSLFKKIKDRLLNNSIECITLEMLLSREDAEIDLLQMDIQGLEAIVLEEGESVLLEHRIKRFLIGTHSEALHERCKQVLIKNGYHILLDQYETKMQPDGILLVECD